VQQVRAVLHWGVSLSNCSPKFIYITSTSTCNISSKCSPKYESST